MRFLLGSNFDTQSDRGAPVKPSLRPAGAWLGIGVALLANSPPVRGESLYGIHWWGWNGESFDTRPAVLLDTAFNRGWTLETIVTHSVPWWEGWYFTGLYSGFSEHNARAITRVDYNWGETVPAASSIGPDAWADHVVTQVVNQLRHGGNIWQVGNEPNLIGEGNNWRDSKISPGAYADIYRAVRGAIHARALNSPLGPHRVLVAPPSPGGVIEGVRWIGGNQWLDQALAAIPNHEIDGVAIHAYGNRHHPVEQSLLEFRRTFAEQMAVIRAHGLAHVPVYMTEFGQPSADADEEARAAQFLGSAFELINQWKRVPGNQNIVAAMWFVYDYDNQAGDGWKEWSIEYRRDHSHSVGSSLNLFTAFENAVSMRYSAGNEKNGPLPVGVRIFDDFETGNGRFNRPLTWSPYSSGFLSAAVQRVAETSYTGSYSQKLTIVDDASNSTPWRLRHLSGTATPANNLPMAINEEPSGFVGLMFRTTTPGISVRLVLDTTDPSTTSGLRAGRSHDLPADGQWHLSQWNLDTVDWGPFPGISGNNGPLPQGTVWINSVLIQGVNADAEIYFDSIMHRANGNLLPMTDVSNSYGQWSSRYETLHGLPDGTLSDPMADTDGDGLVNILEYALESRGADPTIPSRATLPLPTLEDGKLTLNYPRHLEQTDIHVRAVASTDLIAWSGAGELTAPAGFTDTRVDQSGPVETRHASLPISAGDRLFLRLEVTARP